MKKQAIWAMVAGGLLAVSAWGAEVPTTVVYEGVLTDPVTGPLAGEQTIDVRIFEELTGGVALWDATFNTTVDTDGSFQLTLSDEARNPMSRMSLQEAFATPVCYLELHVEGHGNAIAPRIPFASAPQVMAATYANQSPIGFLVAGDLKATSNLVVKGDMVVGATNGAPATLRASSVSISGNGTVGGSVTASNDVTAAQVKMPGTAPVGSIVMWDGPTNSIPDGWEIFERLKDRFPVGVGSGYPLGNWGGEDEVSLKLEQLPAHTHSYEVCDSHNFGGAAIAWQDKDWFKDMGATTMEAKGSGKPHENRPPYHALYYIIRVR